MKKVILILSLVFLLTSCFSFKNNNTNGLIYFNGKNFTIKIPSSWEVLKDKNSILPKPKVWKIDLVVNSKKSKNGFKNNLIILSENIENQKYYNYDFKNISKNFSGYKKIIEKQIIFNDEKKSKLYFFQAKYNSETPFLNFLQSYKVCDNKLYLITIWLEKENKDYKKYEKIISSFSCK